MINHQKTQPFFNKAIIFCFCLTFIVIFLGQMIGITSVNDLIERKAIARFPTLSFNNPDLISQLNSYFSDNFGFRNILLKQYLFVKINLLKGGIEPVSEAFNEWYSHAFYTPEELESWKTFLEREKKQAEKQNIPYFLVVIPTRELVYEEKPDPISYFRHYDFVNYMKNNSSIEVIDPTDDLIKAKGEFPLFYKTDTHWTNYGAYIAYLQVMKLVKKYKPTIKTFQKEDFDIYLEKYDLWLGDRGFNYANNPNRPDFGVKFEVKSNSTDKYQNLGSILEYGDSYLDIQRSVCIPCLIKKFPEVNPLVPLLFVKPTTDQLIDANPEYWFPKARIEDLIPIIRQNIKDKTTQDRIVNYLIVQSILPDRVGLNYFLRLSFNKVIQRDIELKLEQSLIEEYKPDFIMREVIDTRVQHAFNRVKCFYDKDKNFNNLNLEGC